ncbi:MAG: hydrogen peroxide-inducible genes activator [Bacteroidales bacterium]|nr:hydrogen peroxide-inducible genes activator [Bacteroidales bacterium]
MNLQQLEYLVAIDEERHFVRASERCYVTQATLSAMIKKLEEEWACIIFDRSKQPVEPTAIGKDIIKQARVILSEVNHLKALVHEETQTVSGIIKLGIIPTMAPYVLPIFLSGFLNQNKNIQLHIKELTTDEIVAAIEQDKIDIGILATPLSLPNIVEYPVFYEEFVLYAAIDHPILEHRMVSESDIPPGDLWILEEGHCLRSQVINFCNIKHKDSVQSRLEFEAGSIETLINLVDTNGGCTILPELSIRHFSEDKMDQIRFFTNPQPVREVSLVTSKTWYKSAITKAIKDSIILQIPPKMLNNANKIVTSIK